MSDRWVRCPRCGMGWFEYDEPVELLPGSWTIAGPREHTCPEPMSYKQAQMMVQMAQAMGGIVVSQREKAAIRLGLAQGPEEES